MLEETTVPAVTDVFACLLVPSEDRTLLTVRMNTDRMDDACSDPVPDELAV